VPDMLVDEYADGDLLKSLRVRESDLTKHLTNDKDKELEPTAAPKADELEEEQRLIALAKKRKPLEFGSKEDFQLTQALNYLKGLPVQVVKAKPVSETDKDAPSEKDGKKNGDIKKDIKK